MRHWSQLATRNWRANPGRAAATILAIVLGVSTVVWITCCYESLRRMVNDYVLEWVGRSHLNVESPLGKWGQFSAEVADAVADDPHVELANPRLWWRLYAYEPPSAAAEERLWPFAEIDATGIDPRTEYVFRDMERRLREGRLLQPGDRGVVVLEASMADEFGLRLGDTLHLRPRREEEFERAYRIVGLFKRRRITKFQRPNAFLTLPDMQELTGFGDRLTVIDLRLAAGELDRLDAARLRVLQRVRRVDSAVAVASAEAKLRQLRRAEDQMQVFLGLASCVAFLTSFFIILGTVSMGMVERIRQMGLLRCVGVTRWQLATLVPAEILPLGVAGVVVGVPAGFGLVWLTNVVVEEYVADFAVSRLGLVLAVAGGLLTALLGASLPMFRAMSISPLEASKPESAGHPVWVEAAAALVGGVILAAEYIAIHTISPESELYALYDTGGVLCMYVGYALLAPLLVRIIGGPGVWLLARLLGLRQQLLRDQVSRAPWRSGAICSGLMVGLSLIVATLIEGEGIIQGWQFPRQIPEAFVYAFRTSPLENVARIRQLDGVGRVLAVNEFPVEVDKPRSGIYKYLRPLQRFVCADLVEWPRMIKLEYLEGNEEEALRALGRGTGVLVTREYAQTYDKHAGDRITLRANDRQATFDVAGVVASPSIDIAVGFFQAGGEYQFMAVGSVIGTTAQAREHFARHEFKLLVFDFDLPPRPIPPQMRDYMLESHDLATTGELTPEQEETLADDWRQRREAEVFQRVLEYVDDPAAQYGSISMLKSIIDREIRTVTRILTAIPAVALIVAAFGVANLMGANVHARSRQIAILRSVGATRAQVIRLVLGEAAILAIIGSLLGLALGFHIAAQSSYTTLQAFGFEIAWAVPWIWIGYGIAFTSLMCLIAGLYPARRAARNNVIDALQVA